jgi:adenylate cyclase
MSDLENFTSLSEKLTPEDLVRLLNEYLGDAADIIAESGGIVDKFIADAVVGFWGPPLKENHAELACRAALRLVGICDRYKPICQELGCPPLRVRIGIATGEVLVGNIGSASKYNYTVIGDVANLSSRLEGANKLYGTRILATARTSYEAGNSVISRIVDTVRVLGRGEPVELYEIIAEAGDRAAINLAELYAKALDAYRQKKWKEAEHEYGILLNQFPKDGPAELMRSRCQQLTGRSGDLREIDEQWDGVWNLDSK